MRHCILFYRFSLDFIYTIAAESCSDYVNFWDFPFGNSIILTQKVAELVFGSFVKFQEKTKLFGVEVCNIIDELGLKVTA